VTHHIIELEVAMHNAGAVARQMLADVVNDLIIVLVRTTEQLARIDVLDLGLLGFDAREGVAMARVEASLLPEALETY
jgi:hypothetical protein